MVLGELYGGWTQDLAAQGAGQPAANPPATNKKAPRSPMPAYDAMGSVQPRRYLKTLQVALNSH
jgi:hypothetical protein